MMRLAMMVVLLAGHVHADCQTTVLGCYSIDMDKIGLENNCDHEVCAAACAAMDPKYSVGG